MAERKPLVIGAAGFIEEVQSTDTIPVNSSIPRVLEGLKISWLSVSSLEIGIGAARTTSDITIRVSSAITVHITTSGKNGLDTGSEASSTWYYVWLIYNETTGEVAGLLSISRTNPTMPTGFTEKVLIGTIRNGTSSNFLKFYSIRKSQGNMVNYLENADSTLRILTSGGATSFSDVILSSLVPPTSRLALLQLETVNKDADLRPNSETMSSLYEIATNTIVLRECVLDSSQIIEYKMATSGGSLHIEVLGYIEELP